MLHFKEVLARRFQGKMHFRQAREVPSRYNYVFTSVYWSL